PSPWKVSPSPSFSAWISSVNCRSTDEASYFEKKFLEKTGVLHDLGAIKRRAKHRGVRVLAAQPAADAAVDHRRDRVAAQWVGVVLDGQRRATGEPDAGMVAGAGVLVDAVLHSHDPFSGREPFCIYGSKLALALELALALGHDDLQALMVGGHRFLERLCYVADFVVVDGADPVDADAGERALRADVAL